MKRSLFVLCGVAAIAFACISTESPPTQYALVVQPVLDSVFVGDILPPRTVFLLDANGNHHDAGSILWSSNATAVATVDASGAVTGVGKGSAVVIAQVSSGAASGAVVIVSRPLELTLLLDTLFLMPGDTITVPLTIAQKTPAATTLRYDSSSAAGVYTVDTTTGLITAHGSGSARYVARLTDGTNNVSDTGQVIVLSLTDTTGAGRFYMTAFGTAIRHQSGTAFAAHYTKVNGDSAFELVDTLTRNNARETVLITLRNPVYATGRFEIDSLGLGETNPTSPSEDPVCNPKRPWAFWSSVPNDNTIPRIVALSHGIGSDSVAGYLSITQYGPALVGGGSILSGRYSFRAQRTEALLYTDPLGVEMIYGIFVVPLRNRNVCNG